MHRGRRCLMDVGVRVRLHMNVLILITLLGLQASIFNIGLQAWILNMGLQARILSKRSRPR